MFYSAEIRQFSRIIISRPDNIGDVLFTLPLAALLKARYPHCHISFLARDYVKAIVTAYPHVDEFLEWRPEATHEAARQILSHANADTIIHVFPNKKIAKAAKKAGFKNRIGTHDRLFNWRYCNHLVSLERRESGLHEAVLNTKLLTPFKIAAATNTESLLPLLRLQLPLQKNSRTDHLLDPDRFNLIIHPGSNGHGREWPASHFKQLMQQLPAEEFNLFLTGSPQEAERFAESLIASGNKAVNLMGQLSLTEFLHFIGRCDGMLASSTGPLHLAATLGIHALGLFAPKLSLNPQRWAPLGPKAQYLVLEKDCNACTSSDDCACIQAISVSRVKETLLNWVRQPCLV